MLIHHAPSMFRLALLHHILPANKVHPQIKKEMSLSRSCIRIEVVKKISIIYPVVTDDVTFERFKSMTLHWESLMALGCVSVAERFRHRFGTQEVPGSNPVVGTAYTCSHEPTQLSIPRGW